MIMFPPETQIGPIPKNGLCEESARNGAFLHTIFGNVKHDILIKYIIPKEKKS